MSGMPRLFEIKSPFPAENELMRATASSPLR